MPSPPRVHRAFTLLFALLLIVLVFPSRAAGPSYEPPLIVSEEPLGMRQLINLALDNQADYRSALADEDIINELKMGAVGQFLPALDAGASYSNTDSKQEAVYVEGIPIPGTGGTFFSSSSSWYIQARETLFAGLSRIYGYKQAQLQVENTKLGTARSQDLLINGVKTSAYNLLAAERQLEVEREVLEQRRETYRLSRARYETGDVIELDVMQAEIDIGTQENAVLTAEQSVENARESLNLAVGLDLESRYPVSGELVPKMPEIDPDALEKIALRARPDLRRQRNRVKINAYDVKRNTSQYMPAASAFVSYARSESIQDERFAWDPYPGDRYVRYGINLNWTLFDGFQREVDRENAVIAKRKAMWERHRAEQAVAADVRRQWRSLNRLYEQIQVADKNRELARRQLDLEQERYRIGASDQLNLRSAQVTFVSAKREYLTRVLDFFTTMAALERDLGTPLEEVSR